MITKTDFDAKLKNISDRVTNNKSKDLLLDNELKKLKTLVGSSAKIKFDELQMKVNEGVGEALFYPYNVLVNKCSGSCDMLDDPMAKLCIPNVIKSVNMKVYNFLMRLNETRNVLCHESCKCECRLNSSVCNSKQIWNSDTCSCYCNEDFAGIMTCNKGYIWNPSTCACECECVCIHILVKVFVDNIFH